MGRPQEQRSPSALHARAPNAVPNMGNSLHLNRDRLIAVEALYVAPHFHQPSPGPRVRWCDDWRLRVALLAAAGGVA